MANNSSNQQGELHLDRHANTAIIAGLELIRATSTGVRAAGIGPWAPIHRPCEEVRIPGDVRAVLDDVWAVLDDVWAVFHNDGAVPHEIWNVLGGMAMGITPEAPPTIADHGNMALAAIRDSKQEA